MAFSSLIFCVLKLAKEIEECASMSWSQHGAPFLPDVRKLAKEIEECASMSWLRRGA